MGARKRQLRTELVNAAVAYGKAQRAYDRSSWDNSTRKFNVLEASRKTLLAAFSKFDRCQESQ